MKQCRGISCLQGYLKNSVLLFAPMMSNGMQEQCSRSGMETSLSQLDWCCYYDVFPAPLFLHLLSSTVHKLPGFCFQNLVRCDPKPPAHQTRASKQESVNTHNAGLWDLNPDRKFWEKILWVYLQKQWTCTFQKVIPFRQLW